VVEQVAIDLGVIDLRLGVSRLLSRAGDGPARASKEAEYRGILRRLAAWDRETMGPGEETA